MSPVRTWSERRKEASTAPSGFKPLEPAVYNFVIKEPAVLRTTNAGKADWSVKAIVEDGERANAMIFHDFYDSDKPAGVSYLLDQFSALGLDQLLDTEPSDEAIAHALLGRRFSAEVYNDTYNGKVKQKLRNLRAPSGPPVGGALGAPTGGFAGPSAGPGAAPAPIQQQAPAQPVQQFAPQPVVQQQPVQVQETPQYAQPVQQYQQPVQQQPQAVQQPAAGENPWATGSGTGTPLPQF